MNKKLIVGLMAVAFLSATSLAAYAYDPAGTSSYGKILLAGGKSGPATKQP